MSAGRPPSVGKPHAATLGWVNRGEWDGLHRVSVCGWPHGAQPSSEAREDHGKATSGVVPRTAWSVTAWFSRCGPRWERGWSTGRQLGPGELVRGVRRRLLKWAERFTCVLQRCSQKPLLPRGCLKIRWTGRPRLWGLTLLTRTRGPCPVCSQQQAHGRRLCTRPAPQASPAASLRAPISPGGHPSTCPAPAPAHTSVNRPLMPPVSESTG